MKLLNLKATQEAHISADKAWEIIGPQFLHISDWSRGIYRSWNNENVPNRFEGAPAGGRFTFLGKYGNADERIIHYNEDQMEVTWSAKLDFLPNFVRSIKHALKVREIDANLCLLSNVVTVEASSITAVILKRQFEREFREGIDKFLIDWKVYAETGEVSEAKKIDMFKYAF